MKITTLFFLLIATLALQSQTIIEIDTTLKYQTIDGWEAVANPLETSEVRDPLSPHLDSLFALAVNDVGITRLRYSYKSGIEDSLDYFKKMMDGEIDYDEYKTRRYYKVNDNDDPFVYNHDGFQLSGFKDNLELQIIPFKELVEQNDEEFYFNLCFVDFLDQSDFHHSDYPEEYAEFVSYPWYFMDSVYGFTPDGLEIILEPDNADKWNRNNIPAALEAAGNRLSSMGFDPEYIAPSLKSLLGIPQFIEEIAKNEAAIGYLDVISYHRYGGNTNTDAQREIVNLANKYGKKTGMLEYDKNSNVNHLHYDLKYNNVTAWTKYALMFNSDEKFAYVYVDDSGEMPIYDVCKQTKYLRQYFKFIRPGAVRVAVSTTDEAIDPIAFINKKGNQVVVIKTEEGGEVIVNGLKADEYGIKYTLGNYEWGGTDPKEYDIDLAAQTIENGEQIAFTMPDKGVATIYGKSSTPTSNAEIPDSKSDFQLQNYGSYFELTNVKNVNVDYKIISLAGQTISSGIANRGTNKIETETIAPGVYFVVIGSEQFKIMIEK